MMQLDGTQLTGVPVPSAVKTARTVKSTGTLGGSVGVTGFWKGPNWPLRPEVNGVVVALQALRSSVHWRSTPVWSPPKPMPSTETT